MLQVLCVPEPPPPSHPSVCANPSLRGNCGSSIQHVPGVPVCSRPGPRLRGHSNAQNSHQVLPHEAHRPGFPPNPRGGPGVEPQHEGPGLARTRTSLVMWQEDRHQNAPSFKEFPGDTSSCPGRSQAPGQPVCNLGKAFPGLLAGHRASPPPFSGGCGQTRGEEPDARRSGHRPAPARPGRGRR